MNWKKLISHFWEIPMAKFRSQYSGILTVEWANGRKVLNSPRANYSFAGLHSVLKRSLIAPPLKANDKILLLGLGAGSALEIIRKDLRIKNFICAIDIDPVVIEIAQEHFHLREDANTKIICRDALDFVAEENELFQWVICDLFIDDQIPEKLWNIHFFNSVISLLKGSDAQLYINVMQKDLESDKGKELISKLSAQYNCRIRPIKYQNFGIYVSIK